ncbi:putative two component transcriptional regulator, winged helix family [Jonesia denitrificans DSM 20603]|uniref:Putative two component transcriptional regulator, winged helix family n=1 Tax=Jonesia denitrificans (strain ATCC 14870 / DSM 20603 / BCRC 15368 / CIP 55.134 / JCM 11481 / NBRC 15587 / NCTC 10816 / Prevot 55134) TaxID=471856 RepID=C7R045_JONDD|nr:putative two component transcriptional regulator, winged helix family [Jonesia denitrificans DSM 20603]SQH20086.1 Transcriptional regulatory protein YycF [Jonesia denitrificans]
MEVSPIAELLLLTAATGGSAQVLPALGLLAHKVRTLPLDASALVDAPETDVVLIDARKDLVGARATCRMVNATGIDVPVILILTEGGLMVVTSDWGADDFLLDASSPAEVEARLRLVRERATTLEAASHPEEISSGELYIDASGYTARLRGIPLDLTYKEFELLKYLVQHPGRVFTRAQLLQEVWGYDYYGGTRTVDVHVRRLRAKLGVEYEQIIGTVRNVGYRFDPPKDRRTKEAERREAERNQPED